MSGNLAAVLGFAGLFALMLLRVPIGLAMITVGVSGFAAMVGIKPALAQLSTVPMRIATDEVFGVVPLFLLMGSFAAISGMSRELYIAGHNWVGHRRGGLAMATILACGGFAAICGSSVASAATFGKVALPEMEKFGYKHGLAAGTIAAGGTLGILIPPSVVLAIYGILTQQDIAVLFMAGLVPGLLALVLYIAVIALTARLDPLSAPAAGSFNLVSALVSIRGIWPVMLLFVFVIGGIYFGVFTPTEAAAMGAGGTLIICVLRGKLDTKKSFAALSDSARMTGGIFLIAMGALLFGYFLTITKAPQNLALLVGSLDWPPLAVLGLIILGYLFLGMFLDSLAIIMLTVPIMYPVILHLGYDPVWFGILLVMVVEIGLISPPYGMNVFVLKSVEPRLSLRAIYGGVAPFILADLVRVALIVAFPMIVLFLPRSM